MKITRKLLLDMDRQLKLTAQGDITVTSFRLTRVQRDELGNLAEALSLESDFRVTPSLILRTLIHIALQEFNPGVLSSTKAPEVLPEVELPLDTAEALPEILDTDLEPDLEPAVQSKEAPVPWPSTEDLASTEHTANIQKLLKLSLGSEGMEILNRVNSSEE